MAPISFQQTSDPRIVESREATAIAQPAYQHHSLTPPRSPEELTLRILGNKLAPRLTPEDLNTLAVRQSGGIFPIQETYQGLNSGPAPGAVVGIVLGSVGGFLLLIWLLWTLSNGTSFIRTTGELEEVETVRTRRSRSPRNKRTRSRRTEMQSRSDSPRRVYRSERIVRDFPAAASRSPSIARDRDRSRMRETIIVEETRPERRVDGDDIIEVMEEHSSVDVPRRKSRRQSDRSVVVEERVLEDDRRVSGSYRTVDPRRFGGGSFRPHQI